MAFGYSSLLATTIVESTSSSQRAMKATLKEEIRDQCLRDGGFHG